MSEMDWDGTGLPPVGSACERNVTRYAWCESKIYAHSPCGKFAAYVDSCGMNWASADNFRPIRTAEQIAIDGLSKAIRSHAIGCRLPMSESGADTLAMHLVADGYRKQVQP